MAPPRPPWYIYTYRSFLTGPNLHNPSHLNFSPDPKEKTHSNKGISDHIAAKHYQTLIDETSVTILCLHILRPGTVSDIGWIFPNKLSDKHLVDAAYNQLSPHLISFNQITYRTSPKIIPNSITKHWHQPSTTKIHPNLKRLLYVLRTSSISCD